MIYILPTDTCYWMACAIHDLKAYEWIYKIKKRSFDKPLAILVPDFKWLKNNTSLTEEQIDFLKNYNKPFTIITDCSSLGLWINYIDEENNEFINRDIYKKFAFRVANNSIQDRLIKENWPMFLTSANISNNPEIYHKNEIKNQFSYYLDWWNMLFFWENMALDEKNPPSDMFEFVWDSLDINYIRKK